MVSKQQLREMAIRRRNELDEAQRRELSFQIVGNYCGLDYYKDAALVLAYCSVRGELETEGLIARALHDGKQVAVPRVLAGKPEGEQARMEFVKIGPGTNFRRGAYGIPEPEAGEAWLPEQWQGETVEMVLPGLCFDFCGTRIGYGAGYYDRYLSRAGDVPIHRTALAFDFQVFDRLPKEDGDEPFQCLVTEKRYYVL